MFTTQISTIESQRQAILAQIEELKRQEQTLVQESLQYQGMQDEATSLLGAIASLKNKFANHESATSALFAEISKLFQEPPTEPGDKPEERENLVEEATTVDNEQLPEDSAAEVVAETEAESEAEPEPTIKVGDAVQDHKGGICKVIETGCIEGRWYVEVKSPDGRKVAYRPSDLKPVNQPEVITEQEARESILPPSQQVEMPMGIVVGDLVETPHGKVGHITDIRYDSKNCRRIATVALPKNGVDEFSVNDLRYIGKYQPPTETAVKSKAKKEDPELQAQRIGSEILGKGWEEIRVAASACPKALREAGLAARTKTQKKWIEELPQAIADFILSSDDDSDLTWLPSHIKQRVQTLLKEAQQAAA